MRKYRLKIGVAGMEERLQLMAGDDNAARCEALLAVGDLIRDHALKGVHQTAFTLVLFQDGGSPIYEVRVAAGPPDDPPPPLD
ncbi:DUF6894 family protein [Brevundimonas aurantiaca]|jgi:hypothetical protein|uniref:DUF6894 family protein n=1 Tax=Brevundimonas aurantiaca TaxID=74316 RepID=UPI00191ADEC7|nr:hypothetical protein [Brevundimonas aurantiaca]